MKQVPFLLLLLGAPALSGAAEGDPATPATGNTVRAQDADGHRMTAPSRPRRLDLSRLERLQVFRGPQRRAHRSFLTGFVPGFLVGAALGSMACFDAETPCDSGGSALAGGVLGGMALGFVALLSPAVGTGPWQPPHRPGKALRWKPSLAPARGGVGAGLTLRF